MSTPTETTPGSEVPAGEDVRYTPEDLLEMEDGHRFELVDGKLIERNMGGRSSRTAQIINRTIDNYAADNNLGLVFAPDCGYQMFADAPNKVRYPDGSFIARGRLPGEQPPLGHVKIPPDLAIEVISPRDLASEIEQKVQEYLRAGVQQVWVVFPETRSVHVYRGDKQVLRLSADEELGGGDVLPGFSCRVCELFPPA